MLTALNGTAVPVPRPVALCQDPSVVGAPFYLMDYVDGAVLRTREDAGVLTPGQAGLLSQRFVEMLREHPRAGRRGRRAGRVRQAGGYTWPGSLPAGSGNGSCRRPGRCPATTT